jgi:hypothetical protein
MTDNLPMTVAQAATLKRLAQEAYELDAFKPNLARAEADIRIAMLTARRIGTIGRLRPGARAGIWERRLNTCVAMVCP